MEFRIRKTVRTLLDGGVIAYPTEGVYGIGCLPHYDDSVARVMAIKGRKWDAGLILIAADPALLIGWVAPTSVEAERLLTPTDKPTTWIVTAHPRVSALLTGGRSTLAVRITDHPLAAAISNAAGSPLVSTSANRSGKAPAMSGLQARMKLGEELDAIVCGPLGNAAGPSEIRVAASDEVLRPGA